MIVQFIKFNSKLSIKEVGEKAKERLPQFLAVEGLVQKYYVQLDKPNHYGGIYVWDSEESLAAYQKTELCKSIPEAYQVIGKPEVEIMKCLFPLKNK